MLPNKVVMAAYVSTRECVFLVDAGFERSWSEHVVNLIVLFHYAIV